ncbi:hypothetical protein OH491_19245 [Termitidicoccus mucosus]
MKNLIPSSIVLSFALAMTSLSAKVDVYSLGNTEPQTAWPQTFKGNNKKQNTDTNPAAGLSQDSISGGEFGNPVPVGVESGCGMVQTFAGDGKKLEGAGFFMGAISGKANFTLTLIDYGTTPPKSPAALKTGKVVFTEKGALAQSAGGRHYYFDLSAGGDSNLVLPTLLEGNTYGIQLILTGQDGNINFYRSTKAEAYTKGISARLKNDAYEIIGVGGSDASLRKLSFAIYTAK